MTDANTGLDGPSRRGHRPSRRDVLRKCAAATVGLGVGTAVVSRPVAASYCPKTPGYWMNNEWPDEVPDQRETTLDNVNQHVPGLRFDTIDEWQRFLRMPTYGDKGRIMTTHLVATIINFQGVPDQDCWDTGVEDGDGDGHVETVQEVKRLAQQWLKASDFPFGQRSWIVPDAPAVEGETLKDVLDAFNNNAIPMQGCPCYNAESDVYQSRGDGATGVGVDGTRHHEWRFTDAER